MSGHSRVFNVTHADSPEFDHIQPVGKNQICEKSKYQINDCHASQWPSVSQSLV